MNKAGDPPASSTRSTIGIFATKFAIFPLSFLVTISIVHDLGQADYGKYSFLNVLLGFALPMLSFGFGQGITYLVGSGRYKPSDVQVLVLALGILFGAFTAVVVYFLWSLGALTAIRDVPFSLLVVALSVLPFQGMNLMLYRLSMGSSWFVVMNLIDLAKFTITPALLTLFVIILGWKLEGAIFALAGRELLLFLFSGALVLKRARPRLHFPKGFIRAGSGYGIRAWIGDLTAMAYARLDHFLLGSLTVDRVYAVYNIATKVTELLWLPTTALGPVLFNRIASVDDEEERIYLTGRIHRTTLVTVAAGALALAAITPWLIPFVFGAENQSAVVPALILIPGTMAMITQKVLTKYFGGVGRPEKSSLTTVLGTIAIGVSSVSLIPLIGAAGAALASTLGYATMAVTAVVLYGRMIRPRPLHLFDPRRADVAWAVSRIRGALNVWRDKVSNRRNGP